ncbi:GyrI-like domain-containing protein [Cytobacillus dafuensis]|uniref:AraC family transcriptional regulator n=1 Tax=Cytobacillus dafuensis TaxID=1742359 RepID=A0A5B8ZAA5_CYTDA|nr:GyrI-like domain-containing protein [Cytobacillus dafuensis]QED49861.1 AraC family transcriptional regulator [Cytobacillus dafuensis]
MEPKVIKKPSFQVIGYHFEANLREIEEKNLCKEAFEKLQENADKFLNKLGNHVYLIQIYPLKEDFNPFEDQFTQIVGYEGSDSSDVPEGAIHHTVEENLYVAYTHQGPEAELHKTYDYLYGKWIGENGYIPIRYDFELWDERYKPDSSDNEIDLFIAVKKQ